MDIHTAISRMRDRDQYLQKKIAAAPEGKSYWLEQDREAIALAIACMNYTYAMQEYEASQTK
jgi:hypothetical protein